MAGVKRLIQSDITKILIFLTLTALTAALLSPWLYNAGKMIAEVVESRSANTPLLWFAQRCGNADFLQYFHSSLLICGTLLIGPFIMWMQLGQSPKSRNNKPWTLRLPEPSIAHETGQRLRHNPRGWLHFGTGVLLASSLVLLMMWLLIQTDWFRLQRPVMWYDAIKNNITPVVISSVFVEWLLRGVLLGICLRSMRPGIAIFIVSLIYAAGHFLSPMAGDQLAQQENWDAGFRMFELIGQRFFHLGSFALPFLTLWCIGMVLSYARFRTASLWLPIGLHLGWLFVHRVFAEIAVINGEHLASADVFISDDRQSGILPISLIIATALLVHVFIQISEERRATREEKS